MSNVEIISLITLFITIVGWFYTASEQRKISAIQLSFERGRAIYELGIPHLVSQFKRFSEWAEQGHDIYLDLISSVDTWKVKSEIREKILQKWIEWDSKVVYFLSLTTMWDGKYKGRSHELLLSFYKEGSLVTRMKSETIEKEYEELTPGKDILQNMQGGSMDLMEVLEEVSHTFRPGFIFWALTQEIEKYIAKSVQDL